MRKLIDKKVKKLSKGKCHFCPCDIYALLDVHRILPGEEGGKYTDFNTAVCCANCHRKIHNGIIKVIGKYSSTMGYVINWIDENGIEHME